MLWDLFPLVKSEDGVMPLEGGYEGALAQGGPQGVHVHVDFEPGHCVLLE